jgi:hypothetical protein
MCFQGAGAVGFRIEQWRGWQWTFFTPGVLTVRHQLSLPMGSIRLPSPLWMLQLISAWIHGHADSAEHGRSAVSLPVWHDWLDRGESGMLRFDRIRDRQCGSGAVGSAVRRRAQPRAMVLLRIRSRGGDAHSGEHVFLWGFGLVVEGKLGCRASGRGSVLALRARSSVWWG